MGCRTLLRAAALLLFASIRASAVDIPGLTVAEPPSGSLDAEAEAQTTICTFIVEGIGAESSDYGDYVTTESIPSNIPAALALSTAEINCEGPKTLTLYGGPALSPFAGGWTGVQLSEESSLPGSTMVMRDVDLLIQDSRFAGLDSFGQAAIVFSRSNVTFMNTTFAQCNNSAAGAIYTNESSLLTILDSNFTSNSGGAAGTVALWNSSAVVNNTVFYNNTCHSQGGALFANNAQSIAIMESSFLENSATNGGAVYLQQCNESLLYNNVFEKNKAVKSGGALFQNQCSGQLSTNAFVDNKGSNGGSIWQDTCSKVTHYNNQFSNGSATAGCGGIEINQVTTLDISYCTFADGKGVKGGGIYIQNSGGDITESVFTGNNASYGGAVFRGTATGDIKDCTFEKNSASTDGGAIYDSHVEGNIDDCLFSKNTAATSGTSVFRTESSGSLDGNQGIDTSSDSTSVVIESQADYA